MEGDDYRAVNTRARLAGRNLSLDAPVGAGRDGLATLTLSEVLAAEGADASMTAEQDEQIASIREILNTHRKISKRNKSIFQAYVTHSRTFGDVEHATLESIGNEHGICRERVRQIVIKVRNIVRKRLAKMQDDGGSK